MGEPTAITPGAPSTTAAPQAITPGAYLRLRRQAAGLMAGELPLDELSVVAIEGDHRPPTDIELNALAWSFRFDLVVLGGLARGIISRLCRVCGCSEYDACIEQISVRASAPCAWVEADLCSACDDRAPPMSEGLAP